ncbi:MAG: hypothetical protein H0T42_08790 [Deltaproteobacteria bacterium]|nr:hypothetical protein [Deltaproteobacteria bacterium]
MERGRTVDVAPVVENGRIAFVSDSVFTASMGLAGADALCNLDAAAAQLPGTYRAWLGSSAGGPDSRFAPAGDPWRRVDGPRLAPTAADLLSPTSPPYLSTFLNRTASGVVFVDRLWVGSVTENCADWTSTAGEGAVGNPIATHAEERRDSLSFPCVFDHRINCLQL